MLDKLYYNLGYIDRLSYADSPIHRLDPKVKTISVLSIIIAIISHSKYELSSLIPFFIFPTIFIALGDIPVGFLIKRILVISPFPVFVGIFNPLVNREICTDLYGISISCGTISFCSIMIKFILSVSLVLSLLATTPFHKIVAGLSKIGLPKIFSLQLLFLYRYIFLLLEETIRLIRGRSIRNFGSLRLDMKQFTDFLSTLFIRTLMRSERIHKAMLARGFDGTIRSLDDKSLSSFDYLFLAAISLLLIFITFFNPIF